MYMAMSVINISNHITIPKRCREHFLPLDRPALAPLRACGVESAGLSDLVAPFRIGRVAPPFHVVIFTLGGRARWRTLHGSGTFEPGTLWLGPAGETYEYRAAPAWRVGWFHLRRDAGNMKPGSRESQTVPQIEAGFQGLLSESRRSGAPAERLVRQYAEILALLLKRELALTQSNAGPWRELLDALWKKVGDNLQHPWSVQELAAELHVSIVHFHRLVARHQRSSPMAMITKLRIQRASEILLQTNYKLQHVAQMVGYETPFSLSRAFKQHTGKSPRAFRES
jgi:AraC-like DNA-binding protein